MSNEEANMQKKKQQKANVVKYRTRPYYFRLCKQKQSLSSRATTIDSLPDEVVFLILLELEAEEIYNSAMLLCRRWYKITRTQDFVKEHLNRSAPGLLIIDHPRIEDQTFRFLLSEERGRSRRVHTFKYDRIPKYKFICRATCNGLTLEEYPYLGKTFFVANNTINKRIQLPQFPSYIRFFPSIGYAPASNEYKVVCTYDPLPESLNLERCAVLTLGVDKSWRYIDSQHISKELFHVKPLITEGFLHWAQWGKTSFLSLNLETEIITESRVPEEVCGDPHYICYLSTWKSLTLLVASPGGSYSWDVWELSSGEWKMVVKIDLEAQRCRLEQHLACSTRPRVFLQPVGWLNCMEELVLSMLIDARDCVLYNVGTQETDFLDLGPFGAAYYHKKSLVWFD